MMPCVDRRIYGTGRVIDVSAGLIGGATFQRCLHGLHRNHRSRLSGAAERTPCLLGRIALWARRNPTTLGPTGLAGPCGNEIRLLLHALARTARRNYDRCRCYRRLERAGARSTAVRQPNVRPV